MSRTPPPELPLPVQALPLHGPIATPVCPSCGSLTERPAVCVRRLDAERAVGGDGVRRNCLPCREGSHVSHTVGSPTSMGPVGLGHQPGGGVGIDLARTLDAGGVKHWKDLIA